MKKYCSGPSIEATLFVVPQGVVSVKLTLLQPSQKFSWEVVEHSSSKKVVKAVDEWVEAYCARSKAMPYVPIVLDGLPSYTREVLLALYQLPFRDRVTYKQLAVLTGNALASRAVGNACGRNPCPLIIPCHHVFSSSGLGGFSLGLEMKKNLLAFETC